MWTERREVRAARSSVDTGGHVHTSTKWLIGEIALTATLIAVLAVAGFPLLIPYGWHRLLHTVGAVIFLGNIIVTGVWMLQAERSNDWSTLRFASRAVNWADVIFTAPGVMLLLANGLIMAPVRGGLSTSWIAVALGLFLLSGVIWGVFLIRYQEQLIRLSSDASEEQGPPPAAFLRVLHRWYAWGTAAIILPLLSLGLMVLKPTFW